MKNFIVAICLLIAWPCFAKISNSQVSDATPVLQKVADKLSGLASVSYTYNRVLDYPGEGYHNELTATAYLNFTAAAQFISLRYQFSNSNQLTVYNGSEIFSCDKKNKTIQVNNSPTIKSFQNMSFFFNSYVTLKNALPGMIANPSIAKVLSDTTIAGQSFYVANIILVKNTLDPLGGFDAVTNNLIFNYKVIINKSSYLPVEVLQLNNANKDMNKTLFTNIDTHPADPPETSWYASSYAGYTLQKPKQALELIKPQTTAPDLQFSYLKDQATASLSNYKGKTILLEFWIKDCSYCIAAAPKLNALYKKYHDKNFELLAINTHDTPAMMNVFKEKHDVQYALVRGDSKIDHDYGVEAFPMAVLIGKNGRVLYAGAADTETLETLIDLDI